MDSGNNTGVTKRGQMPIIQQGTEDGSSSGSDNSSNNSRHVHFEDSDNSSEGSEEEDQDQDLEAADRDWEVNLEFGWPPGRPNVPESEQIQVDTLAGHIWTTRQERREFFDQHAESRGDWYESWVPPDNPVPELYQPQGTFYTNRLMNYDDWDLYFRDDFYHLNGIPHEVTGPDGERMCFQLWMLRITRGWWKEVDQPYLNPDTVGDIYHRGQINFFRVMRSRVGRNVKCAVYTRFARRRQWEGLCKNEENVLTRQRTILFSLTGDNARVIYNPNSDEVSSLQQFIRSDFVRVPFQEYHRDYLVHNPDTSNPIWSYIQSSLHNPALAELRMRAYGSGYISPNEELDKTGWGHEDHANKFIISIHYAFRDYVLSSGYDASDVPAGWRTYAFRSESRPDVDDQYWFAYSLLMLLTVSWQHNLLYPSEHYSERLVPALYQEWTTGQKMLFPHHVVGLVDVSPFTPWVIDDRYESRFNFSAAREAGEIGRDEGRDLMARESSTVLGDNGNRIPDPQQGWRDSLKRGWP
ncbi:hypothetical protein F5Y02DRAFT_156824 [Annulohypoxylon stygium]|nr:hypothetical protein F5Y02DRAFT_156824 [Annulohypoxylon stygium]